MYRNVLEKLLLSMPDETLTRCLISLAFSPITLWEATVPLVVLCRYWSTHSIPDSQAGEIKAGDHSPGIIDKTTVMSFTP